MLRKSFTFSVGLAVITISSLIPITAQPRGAQPSDAKTSLPAPSNPAGSQRQEAAAEQKGSGSPVTVIVNQPPADPEAHSPQHRPSHQSPDPNWAIAAITFALLWVAFLQWRTYENTLATNKQIARGYVELSHLDSGLHLDTTKANPYRVRLRITNSGQTPIAVNHGAVRLVADLNSVRCWPETASTDQVIPGGFLVREKEYFSTVGFTPTTTEWAQIQARNMWLVGWLFYSDAFGGTHRVGYARFINPGVETGKNNLWWDEVSARHNYDEDVNDQGQAKKNRKYWPW